MYFYVILSIKKLLICTENQHHYYICALLTVYVPCMRKSVNRYLSYWFAFAAWSEDEGNALTRCVTLLLPSGGDYANINSTTRNHVTSLINLIAFIFNIFQIYGPTIKCL